MLIDYSDTANTRRFSETDERVSEFYRVSWAYEAPTYFRHKIRVSVNPRRCTDAGTPTSGQSVQLFCVAQVPFIISRAHIYLWDLS